VHDLDLTSLGLKDAAEKIRQGQLTSYELTTSYLTRIKQLNGKINAFITITEDAALRSAKAADRDAKNGIYRGKLHGIPIALKDVFDTRNVRTTGGSKLLAGHVPTEDAYVVQQLENSGAVMLGKLNLHEWALGVTSANPHFGSVMNPWNFQHVPGGSSGGSAAAVASRLCAASLGTDTGGSIRIPSSFCGTVGLKPTYGCVSLRGVIPLSWSLDHVGPIAKTVADAAIMFEAVNGYDPSDPASIPRQPYSVEESEHNVEKFRILLPKTYFFEQADDGVIRALHEAVRRFETLGAKISEGNYPWVEDDMNWQIIVLLSEAAAYHTTHLLDHPNDIGNDVLTRLKRGQVMGSVDLATAYRKMVEMRRRVTRVFDQVDMIITPTTPSQAPLLAGLDPVIAARKLTRFTAPFNFAGLPAISVPCGFTDGLPIGMQLVAGPWKESILLQAAHAYESSTEWHKRETPIV